MLVTCDKERETVLNTFFSSVSTMKKEGYNRQDAIVSNRIPIVSLWLTEDTGQHRHPDQPGATWSHTQQTAMPIFFTFNIKVLNCCLTYPTHFQVPLKRDI